MPYFNGHFYVAMYKIKFRKINKHNSMLDIKEKIKLKLNKQNTKVIGSESVR